MSLLSCKLKEYLIHDSSIFRLIIGLLSLGASVSLLIFKRYGFVFELLSKLYGSGVAPWSDRFVIRLLRTGLTGGWVSNTIEDRLLKKELIRPEDNPLRLIGKRFLVVKKATEVEKGVLVLDYNYTFPIFVKCFDLRKIAEKYYIYVEPSWTGLLNDEILCLEKFPGLIVCGAYEPRDYRALKLLNTNIRPAAIGANCFVDDTIFTFQEENTNKRYDLIMVASWGSYKRHYSFLKCVAKLKQRYNNIRIALVGYPQDLTIQDIRSFAHSFDLEQNIDFYEKIPPNQVKELLCSSKINVLWSRREGTSRTPFEGFLCNTPILLRCGFNYGHSYDYINNMTGRFADEKNFVETVVDMLSNYSRFSARQWMIQNFSAEVSTKKLEKIFAEQAAILGESWINGIEVRFSQLNGQTYSNSNVYSTFSPDYKFITECLYTDYKTQYLLE